MQQRVVSQFTNSTCNCCSSQDLDGEDSHEEEMEEDEELHDGDNDKEGIELVALVEHIS